MTRFPQDDGRRAPASIADEAGFTLVELLVAMVVLIIVLGAGTYGLADAFKQNTQITGRAQTTSSAEVGIERLALDLRGAVNSSCVSNTVTVSGLTVSETFPDGPSYPLYSLTMCEPDATPTSGGGFSTTSTQPVVWTCNTAPASESSVTPETCASTVNGSGNTTFHGIADLTLTGVVDGVTTTLASQTYTLQSGSTASLSWVGISAEIAELEQPGSSTNVSTVPNSSLIPVQTGAELRNYGTNPA